MKFIIILTLVAFAVAAVAVAVFVVLSAEQAPKHISNDWKNGPKTSRHWKRNAAFFQPLETAARRENFNATVRRMSHDKR